MTDLAAYRRAANRLALQHAAATQRLARAKAGRKAAKAQAVGANEATGIAQAIAQGCQQAAHKRIATIVAQCLATVYDDKFGFGIDFTERGHRTEAIPYFTEGRHRLTPGRSSAGGVMDVAAFGLRMAALTLGRPRPRPILFMDEPFRAVHGFDYRNKARELLLTISHEMGVQIIMATGVEELKCGKVIEVDDV